MPLNDDEVVAVIRRLVKAGPMDALPRKQADLAVLLALASSCFTPGRVYREADINAQLAAWLARFATADATDHVTFRRLLVDEQILIRNPRGTAYRVSFSRGAAYITDAARDIDPGAVLEDERRQRAARKRARVARSASSSGAGAATPAPPDAGD
jgi:hypothetical protein